MLLKAFFTPYIITLSNTQIKSKIDCYLYCTSNTVNQRRNQWGEKEVSAALA